MRCAVAAPPKMRTECAGNLAAIAAITQMLNNRPIY
jgi:hypothetical protein